MEKTIYKELIKKYTPKENRIINSVMAFIMGGLVGVLAQLLIDIYMNIFDVEFKVASTIMITTLIFIGCFLTCLNFFDKLVNIFRCGLIIPITGFAHSMMSATLDYKKEGIITGMGSNMFKLSGSVIMCGVVSAYIFGLLRLVLEVIK